MITAKQFVQHMESALSRYYLDTLKTSTEQWQKRNSGNTISGSGFAKCLRLCYYRWFDTNREHKDPAFGDKLDITSQRNMFHGLLVEEVVIKAITMFGLPGGSLVHKNQDSPPVVLTDIAGDITRSAANDCVLECMDEQGKYFIPFECKTTDRTFGRRDSTGKFISADDWWKSFKGYIEAKRQLMQWIWLAHKNEMRVPFGVLYYQRRGTLETKYIIVAVHEDNLYKFDGVTEVLSYYAHEDELTARNNELVFSIEHKQEPAYDPEISQNLCKSCLYLKQCKETR